MKSATQALVNSNRTIVIEGYANANVADATRPADDRAADAIRSPAATLAFAGVKPGMVVGELYPCGGYFSHMISDVVAILGSINVIAAELDR